MTHIIPVLDTTPMMPIFSQELKTQERDREQLICEVFIILPLVPPYLTIYYLFENLSILQTRLKIFQPQKFINCTFGHICMHLETRCFLIFQNILETTRNSRVCRDFFSNSVKYFFCKKLGAFNEIFLACSSLTCDIFATKSWFLRRAKS